MSEKKYFWLRLQRDFFKRHDIRIIEDMENGKDYILFYLKLLVESIDHEGNLRFSDTIPYNEKMLSTITNTNIDIVRSALEIFTNLGMMERLEDGTLFMSEVQKMIGASAENDQQRENHRLRQQRYRDRKRLDVTDTSQERHCDVTRDVELEIESNIELDKELEIDKDINNQPTIHVSFQNDPTRSYGDKVPVVLTNDEFKELRDLFGLPTLLDYINRLSAYMDDTGKTYRSHYTTLKNWILRDRQRAGDKNASE